MTIELSIKKYKIFILQKEYIKMSKILFNLQHHILQLNNNFMISSYFYNEILSNLYDIIRTINKRHNCYVIDECTSDIELDNSDEIININNINLDNLSENELFEKIYIISKNVDMKFSDILPHQIIDIKPLNEEWDKIINIIQKVGYNNINNGLKIANSNFYKNTISKESEIYLDYLNDIFIVCSIEQFILDKEADEYYWKEIKNKDKYDYLEQKMELWVKANNIKNLYFKIIGFFTNDLLNIINKNLKLFNNNIYIKKKEINNILKKNNNIEDKFKKNILKFMNIKYLICYPVNEIIYYIESCYDKYVDLCEISFINIMKDFISSNTSIKKMHEIIYLLLIGNSEKEDVSGLLFGLTKEKRINNYQISDIIYYNLNYLFQVKINQSNDNIKNEIEKIKSFSVEDVDFKKQIALDKNMPEYIKVLTYEKIDEMKMNNNEYHKQLTYVKHLIKFPWASEKDNLFYKNLKNNDIKAKNYLETIENKLKDLTYGHMEAKNSLLQIIGKWISNPSSEGSSMGLVGPPGVGKTLLAKSVSEVLNIPFIQITLGGQNDGELLHGHGYTYSGSQPGMIVRQMSKVSKSRCIIYFDELDKACSKHGNTNEITSILIHLTDPNMNKSFQDRFYQGIDFPLNKVILIFSYNDSSLVDPILLDRIKEITIKPFSLNDKLHIVKNFIIPEISKNIGFEQYKINFSDTLIKYIIDQYTNEAGVRNIKRKIEEIYMNLNLDKIYFRNIFKKNKNKNITITKKYITTILQKSYSDNITIHPKSMVGIINGLYATTSGCGGIIPIQIYKNYSYYSNNFELKLTGNQGDVMKESVNCSYTTAVEFIKTNLEKFNEITDITNITNINEHIKDKFPNGFHIHTPSTSTPKDGPSAGSAFTSTFISRILNKPIKNYVAMTGEIELTGNITKIGGLQFKLIGAKKAGVKTIYVPMENKDDLDEIKKKFSKLINKDFQVFLVKNIKDFIFDIFL